MNLVSSMTWIASQEWHIKPKHLINFFNALLVPYFFKMQFTLLISMIYFLINLKLKKLLFHPFLSMICFCNPSPTRLLCFFFLNISLENITFALFFCKSIRWKIIYEIKYLLNLMACMTYIEGLVGWLRFTCFFF
jgi:hypothetical protein